MGVQGDRTGSGAAFLSQYRDVDKGQQGPWVRLGKSLTPEGGHSLLSPGGDMALWATSSKVVNPLRTGAAWTGKERLCSV